MPQEPTVLRGHIVEEETLLTLDELSGMFAVETRRIVELVDEGVLETPAADVFGGDAMRRARIALRLQHDLGVNLAGTALALQLLERIADLERRLRDVP